MLAAEKSRTSSLFECHWPRWGDLGSNSISGRSAPSRKAYSDSTFLATFLGVSPVVDIRVGMLHTSAVIKGFRHKGLQRFFETGSKAGIQTHQAAKLRRQLAVLNRAKEPNDMNMPGWRLHPLTGPLSGHWAVSVSSSNWRLTFSFDGEDAVAVDCQDYH